MKKRHVVPLNALRAFEAAGRSGRITLAAEELGVSHSAISRHVSQLEDQLGVRLFEGPKSNLRLTDAGKRLLPSLTEGLDQIDAGVRSVSARADRVLDVSCLSTFMMRWLIPRLFDFTQSAAGFEPRLSASDAPVNFERGNYQVAIRVDDHTLPPAVITTDIFAEHVGLVASTKLLVAHRCNHISDVSRLPRLHTKTRRRAWKAWAMTAGIPLGKARESEHEHFYFMLEAATAGLGACIAPWPLVADDIRAGRLRAPFGFVPSGHRYLAIRPERSSRRAENFCAWLGEQGRSMDPPPQASGFRGLPGEPH